MSSDFTIKKDRKKSTTHKLEKGNQNILLGKVKMSTLDY